MGNEKRRILAIASDEEIRSSLIDFVKGEGYEMDFAEKGTYAFQKLMTGLFDLIITDMRLPGFSGLDILPGLKQIHPRAPIVVIAAAEGDSTPYEAYERGAKGHLKKPIQLNELRELIHEMVSSKGRRS